MSRSSRCKRSLTPEISSSESNNQYSSDSDSLVNERRSSHSQRKRSRSRSIDRKSSSRKYRYHSFSERHSSKSRHKDDLDRHSRHKHKKKKKSRSQYDEFSGLINVSKNRSHHKKKHKRRQSHSSETEENQLESVHLPSELGNETPCVTVPTVDLVGMTTDSNCITSDEPGNLTIES